MRKKIWRAINFEPAGTDGTLSFLFSFELSFINWGCERVSFSLGGGELMMMASGEWRTANSEGRTASCALQVQPQPFPITTRAALFKLKHLMDFAFSCSYSIVRISRLSEYSLLSLS